MRNFVVDMNTMELKNQKEHYAWVDALRVLACFLVVAVHSCDPFVSQGAANEQASTWGLIIGSMARASVPLFVMMTAVLLMPMRPPRGVGAFYRKRLGRLVVPLIFWSLMLPVMGWAYYHFVNPATRNVMLSAEAYTEGALFNKLYTWIFNFNFDTTPLWYLYMLAGLYLIIPILDGWLAGASKKDVRTVLIVWLLSSFMPYCKFLGPVLGYEGVFGNPGIWGECDWNPYGTFYYVSGFVGYMILAYYLKKWPLQWSAAKMWGVFVPLFVAGYAYSAVGALYVIEAYPGNSPVIEMIWSFNGLNVIAMTVGVFCGFQRLRGPAPQWLTGLAGLTFGIYLCHYPLEYVFYDFFDLTWLHPAARIVLGAAATFAAAWLLCRLLSLTRLTRRLIQ